MVSMQDDEVRELIARSIEEPAISADVRYTNPRTWGVYELKGVSSQAKRFRFGNHPVRQGELEREFDGVSRVALYESRDLAKLLADKLNTPA